MGEIDEQIENLPALQRLALSYAPGGARWTTLSMLSLDNRLAAIVRKANEPVLAQIKLAWWRDLLAQDPGQWPKGEPLLALLKDWGSKAGALSQLVDGWEMCVGGGELNARTVKELADARGAAFAALAERLGHPGMAPAAARMGCNWAMADLAAHLPNPDDREQARAVLPQLSWRPTRLPRDLRPLSVLHGMAARSVRKGTAIDQLSPASLLPAMRIGLFGR